MRNISVAITEPQILAESKDVTRRLGWADLQPGTLLQPVRKGQGLKKGEKVHTVGRPIKVVSVRRERLSRLLKDDAYAREELRREGFPQLTPEQFVRMFCEANGCRPSAWVTRIEFEFVLEAP